MNLNVLYRATLAALLLLVSGNALAGSPAPPLNRVAPPSVTAALIDEPQFGVAEEGFFQAARDFLIKEGLDPNEIQLEMRPLRDRSKGTTGHWRALAQVFVDRSGDGRYIKRLSFDREYWIEPGEIGRFEHRRWSKVMWHEIHHLQAFPVNLDRSVELGTLYPAKDPIEPEAWNRQWLQLLEPLEEMAAERHCLEKYRAAFGDVPDVLMNDSRADMRKHAARYKELLAAVLGEARDPGAVLQAFPAELSVDAEGNILGTSPDA